MALNKIIYPATQVCHWVTGPVACCDKHAADKMRLGEFMGTHVAVTQLEEPTECVDCANEAGLGYGYGQQG